jgi:uncharacterized protein YjbI with pentapeptide repeats
VSYSVIYLDGTNGLPFKECEVCKKIKRNVIEPVAIFVPKEKEKEYKEKFKNLSDNNLQKELESIYKNTKWYKNNYKNFATCIFHCEKENEIWMENFNDGYEEYTKRRDEAINKKEPFDENFEIKWNEFLVEEFWKRIRAYRFAIDYIELWEKANKNWDKFLESLNQIPNPPLGINKYKNLILFNLNKISIGLKFYTIDLNYDFKFFNFPKFDKYNNKLISKEQQQKTIYDKKINFFFIHEKLFFKHQTYFDKSKFIDNAYFKNIIFEKNANFEEVIFNNASFENTTFNDEVDFSKAIFYGSTNFKNSTSVHPISFLNSIFINKVYFWNNNFFSEVDFTLAKFLNRVLFHNNIFTKNVNFLETEFKHNVTFHKTSFIEKVNFHKTQLNNIILNLEGKTGKFILNDIYLKEKSKIEIKNLKTVNLSIEEVNNSTDNFFFYNTDIITLKNYKEYYLKYIESLKDIEHLKKYLKDLKENIEKENIEIIDQLKAEPNLTIKNSHLNKMKFINCDFSNAKNIHIEGSELTEVKFINTEWGKFSEKRICPDLFEKEPKKARETYRQLKYSLDNQKDHINANEFFSLEMKAYGKSLKWNNWQDKIVFTINKWTSDFGQSWIRPLIWIIILTSLMSLYLHYKEINLQLIFNNDNLNWSMIINSLILMIENFFSTLNVFKIFGNLNNHYLNLPCFYTFSSIYTILLAFFIYQFIIAVKRKTKR